MASARMAMVRPDARRFCERAAAGDLFAGAAAHGVHAAEPDLRIPETVRREPAPPRHGQPHVPQEGRRRRVHRRGRCVLHFVFVRTFSSQLPGSAPSPSACPFTVSTPWPSASTRQSKERHSPVLPREGSMRAPVRSSVSRSRPPLTSSFVVSSSYFATASSLDRWRGVEGGGVAAREKEGNKRRDAPASRGDEAGGEHRKEAEGRRKTTTATNRTRSARGSVEREGGGRITGGRITGGRRPSCA